MARPHNTILAHQPERGRERATNYYHLQLFIDHCASMTYITLIANEIYSPYYTNKPVVILHNTIDSERQTGNKPHRYIAKCLMMLHTRARARAHTHTHDTSVY